MTEPFGTGAGVVGVLGLTIQITQILITFGLDWKDAPADVKQFRYELGSLKHTMLTMQDLAFDPEFTKAFEEGSSALLQQLETVNNSASTTQKMLKSCHASLCSLQKELDKGAKGHRFGWHRLKAAFLSSHTREAVENLQRQAGILHNMVSRDTAILAATTLNRVKEAAKQQQDWRTKEENAEALSWLSATAFKEKHNDIYAKHYPGTGNWFLKSDVFLKWKEGDPNSPSLLWCPGIPGAGKSVMSSIVVEHLVRTADTCVCYVYCDYKDRRNQTPGDLLSSLAKQMVLQLNSFPEEVKTLSSKYPHERPPMEEYARLICTLSTSFHKIFFVVDALDEHISEEDGSYASRSEFLAQLRRIENEVLDSTAFRLFITSRDIQSIRDQLKECAQINIHAEESDIRLYLRSRLVSSKFRFANQLQRNAELTDTIIEKLVQSAQGMFLLPKLHMDRLGTETSIRGLKKALDNLPTKVNDLYHDAMARIACQGESDKQLAMRTLRWVACSLEPLRLKVLLQGVAIEPGDRFLDEESLPPAYLITSVTAGLVTHHEERRIIQFSHFTVAEYFKDEGRHWLEGGDEYIAETCITCLSFDTIDPHLNFLFRYASTNWGHHARERAIETAQSTVGLLEHETKVARCARTLFSPHPRDAILVRRFFMDKVKGDSGHETRGIHIAAHFGLHETTNLLLSRGHSPLQRDHFGRTPAEQAAGRGHGSIVQLLISQHDGDLIGPLVYAAKFGKERIVQLLLAKECNPFVRGYHFETPLAVAARVGHESICKLMLKHGKEHLDAGLNHDCISPVLSQVVHGRGNVAIIKLLLANRADVNWKDEIGRTALSYAVRGGRRSVIKLLLKRGAHVNYKDVDGMTPLAYGIYPLPPWCEKPSCSKLLLDNGADREMKDAKGRTPLILAAEQGFGRTARLLLEDGADMQAKDAEGKTALFYAALQGRDDVTRILLENGVDLEGRDAEGRTPLMHAARTAGEPTVKLLLEKGAACEARDARGNTPLMWATQGWGADILKLLLEFGADQEARDAAGRTALMHFAMGYEKNRKVLEQLLDNGADIEARDAEGRTPLIHAVIRYRWARVRLLLMNGANQEVKDEEGRTALSWAKLMAKEPTQDERARRVSQYIVKLLSGGDA